VSWSGSDDRTHSTEGTTESIHTRILDTRNIFLVDRLRLTASGLEEHGAASVELLELWWVDLGHLQDGDAYANRKEREDDREDLRNRGFQALVENLPEWMSWSI
jgi:hypothetical protein